MDRKYVIVSNDTDNWPTGSLLFWGRRTPDNAKRRSFEGYTTSLDDCEMYTKDELIEFRKGYEKIYPFLDELEDTTIPGFLKTRNVLCTIEDLESIGFHVWRCVIYL